MKKLFVVLILCLCLLHSVVFAGYHYIVSDQDGYDYYAMSRGDFSPATKIPPADYNREDYTFYMYNVVKDIDKRVDGGTYFFTRNKETRKWWWQIMRFSNKDHKDHFTERVLLTPNTVEEAIFQFGYNCLREGI